MCHPSPGTHPAVLPDSTASEPYSASLSCPIKAAQARRTGAEMPPGTPPSWRRALSPSVGGRREMGAGGRDPTSVAQSPAGKSWDKDPRPPGRAGGCGGGVGRSASAPSGGGAGSGSGGQEQAARGRAAEPASSTKTPCPYTPPAAPPLPRRTGFFRDLPAHRAGLRALARSPGLLLSRPSRAASGTRRRSEGAPLPRGERAHLRASPSSAAAAPGFEGHSCFSLEARLSRGEQVGPAFLPTPPR